PIGLGRSAVFASDVKDRWATDWIKWRGYGPFFASIVRAVQRQPQSPVTLDVTPGPVRAGTRAIAISVEARDANGKYRDLLKPTVHIESARGNLKSDVVAHQTAPGRYEASVVVDASDALSFNLAGSEVSTATRIVLPDPNEEYRLRP